MHEKYDCVRWHCSKFALLISGRRGLTAIEADVLNKVVGRFVPRAFERSKVTIYDQILTDFRLRFHGVLAFALDKFFS